jgi:rhamnogalacturonan endolyase
MLFCTATSTAIAEDPAERQYLAPALNPKHKDKPKVTGWAKERIDEKINRGMLAIPNKKGQVYTGWRLLSDDDKETVFNVYRSVEGGEAVKLNKAQVVATTDFIDKQPTLGARAPTG